MFVKQWEEKATVSEISFQFISFEIKKYICLLKIVKKQWTQALMFGTNLK